MTNTEQVIPFAFSEGFRAAVAGIRDQLDCHELNAVFVSMSATFEGINLDAFYAGWNDGYHAMRGKGWDV